ncbi:MAG: FtsX-like permease family protein [Anaerolineae bacterium]|nr:FtsX-like permease family protein [Anaerolineae bacterium]
MGVVRHKIWSDLWNNKSRTLQVVLIIAMGAFAVGMIVGSSDLIRVGLTKVWQASSPSMINMSVDPRIDDETLESLKSVRGVEDVDAALLTTIEWRHNASEEWRPARLLARDDFDDQTYAKLSLVSGDWPTRKAFGVMQGIDTAYEIPQGSAVQVRIEDKIYTVDINGVIYNPLGNPPGFGGNPEFYTTRQRFGELTGEDGYDQLYAGVPVYSEAAATEAADGIERRLEKLDVEALSLPFPPRVTSPEKHAFQDVLDGIFLILAIMAVLTLMLGLLLVYNTINAIVSQQVNQIGIMKAVGAKVRQILRVYITMVFVYGLLSILLAIPLGALGAYGLSTFMLTSFNVAPEPFSLSMTAVLVQVAICLLAPLLVSLIPIFSGARITVREAISTYGLSAGAGRMSRALAKIQNLSRIILLMISNTFRNRGRVILTQVTLVGSGVIFMMVIGAQDSAKYTFRDILFDILNYNVTFQFEDSERIDQIESLALAHPDVAAVEMWGVNQATLRLAGQPETNDDENTILWGVPLPTELYVPRVRQGRWLEPGDTYAIVMNQDLAQDAGVTLGDRVVLDHNLYGETEWTIVGLLLDPAVPNSVYMDRDMLLKITHSVGKAETVWIKTVHDDAASELAAAASLRQYFNERKLDVRPEGIFPMDTATALADQILQNFGVIMSLLATLAVVMGIVGAIALSGMLSLSVLERTREIGVMRAIGATSRIIATLFVGEGLTMGLLSWLIAMPLSIPAAYLLAKTLGIMVENEILYNYTPTGAVYWLVIITVLSIAASWFPARSATRISVRESLAYQ